MRSLQTACDGFTNWALGEPNNHPHFGCEEVLHFYPSYGPTGSTWNDGVGLETVRGYVVEWDTASDSVRPPSRYVFASRALGTSGAGKASARCGGSTVSQFSSFSCS